MGIGSKMCKYKSFSSLSIKSILASKQQIYCSNPDITDEDIERINKDLKLCSRRLCKHYESR